MAEHLDASRFPEILGEEKKINFIFSHQKFIYCAERMMNQQGLGPIPPFHLTKLLPVLTHHKSSTSVNTLMRVAHSPAPVKSLVSELCGSCGDLLPGYGAGPAAVPVAAGLGE